MKQNSSCKSTTTRSASSTLLTSKGEAVICCFQTKLFANCGVANSCPKEHAWRGDLQEAHKTYDTYGAHAYKQAAMRVLTASYFAAFVPDWLTIWIDV